MPDFVVTIRRVRIRVGKPLHRCQRVESRPVIKAVVIVRHILPQVHFFAELCQMWIGQTPVILCAMGVINQGGVFRGLVAGGVTGHPQPLAVFFLLLNEAVGAALGDGDQFVAIHEGIGVVAG